MYRLGVPLLAAMALLLAGCGGAGGDNVADIGGKVGISQDSYDRWLATIAQMSMPGSQGVVPDGPDYKKCIAAQASSLGKKANKATLKQLCEAQDRALRQQVLQQLVQQGWVRAEAESQKLKADPKAVQQQVTELRRQYPEKKGGVNNDDLKAQAEANVLQQQLRQAAGQKLKSKPTEAQLRQFYQKKQSLFATQPSRDVYLLLTDSRAGAEAAASALRGGASWNKIFRQYNSSRLWSAKTALLRNVAPSSWLPELRSAIFGASTGVVVGPVKIKPLRAYAVLQVKSAKPGKPAPSFAKSKGQVEQAWLANRAAEAGQQAITKLQTTWQSKTDCTKDYAKWYPCKGVSNKAG